MSMLMEVIRVIRGAGGKAGRSCGFHVHLSCPEEFNVKQLTIPRTYGCYLDVCKAICKELGHISIGNLTSERLMKYFKFESDRGLRKSSLDKRFLILKSIVNYAIEKDVIIKSPFGMLVKKPKSKVESSTVDADGFDENGGFKVYSNDELKRILSVLDSFPEMRPLLMVLLHTGIRIEEACALMWKNIDFANKTIYVVQAVKGKYEDIKGLNKGMPTWYVGEPKSKKSTRKIPVKESLLNELLEWRKYLDSKTDFSRTRDSGFVFPSRAEAFSNPDSNASKLWRFQNHKSLNDMLKDIELTFHKFRHTFATNLINSGVDVKRVQKLMGHADIHTTYLYVTVKQEDLSVETDKVQSMYEGLTSEVI